MANIYLVNALYNKDKPGLPAACPPQSTARIEEPSRHECKSADAMHPSRQQIINVLGPLQQEPEPVAYKVSGANTQPVGYKMPPAMGDCIKSSAGRANVASGPTITENVREEYGTVRAVRAARPRSIPAAAPSTTFTGRSGQNLQPFQVNRIMVERDPRRRATNVNNNGTASCSGLADVPDTLSRTLKQEDVTSELFSAQSDPKMFASPTDTASPHRRADSLRSSPMVGRGQPHKHLMSPTAPRQGEQPTALKHSDYDPPYDSEIRIRELEDENIALRMGGFRKDREIRKLKAELLRKGAHGGSFDVGMKRPRYDEGLLLMNDRVREA